MKEESEYMVKKIPASEKGLGVFMLVTGLIFVIPLFIVGIPVAIFGIVLLMQGKERYIGSCPVCGNSLTVSQQAGAVTCRRCKKRIVARDGTFRPVQ